MAFTALKPPAPAKPSKAPISKPAANPFFAGVSNAPYAKSLAPTTVQSSPVKYTGSTPQSALAPLPAPAPQASGQSAGTSGTQTSQSSSGVPLDATALGNIAENTFKANNQIGGLNTDIGNLQTNLQAALAQLAYQQPRDQLSLEQGANRNGALYSSVYNQNLGDLNHKYSTQQSGLTTTEGQQEGGLRGQISAILGGIPLYNQGQAALSGQRTITAAQSNPATGQPTTKPPTKPKANPVTKVIQSGSWKAAK